MMRIYNYHPQNGEYLGTTEAKESPREEGVYLIPAHATTIEPPATQEHECAVFNGSEWELVPDHRGETYYTSWDDEGTTIENLRETVPTDAYIIKPEKPPLTYEEQVEHVRRQRELEYRKQLDPLTNEYQVKILTGKTADAEALIPLIIAEREAIQAEYPWPVEGE